MYRHQMAWDLGPVQAWRDQLRPGIEAITALY